MFRLPKTTLPALSALPEVCNALGSGVMFPISVAHHVRPHYIRACVSRNQLVLRCCLTNVRNVFLRF